MHDADVTRWLLGDEIAGVEVRIPRRSTRGKDPRDPTVVLLHMASGVLIDVEISVNIAYDIRGEVSSEEGVAALPNRPATSSATAPASGRRRALHRGHEQEFREWVVATGQGSATGPSTWDGYAATLVADAAPRAVGRGGLERIAMRNKPELHRQPVAVAA